MRQDAPSLSDGEDVLSPDSAARKRKRDGDQLDSAIATPSDGGPEMKRLKEDEAVSLGAATPPPPPPPPPESDTPASEVEDEQQRALVEQEEALIRENEEAQRLEDEAIKTKQREVAADDMQREIDALKSGNQELLSH